jgi:hypothetical protein
MRQLLFVAVATSAITFVAPSHAQAQVINSAYSSYYGGYPVYAYGGSPYGGYGGVVQVGLSSGLGGNGGYYPSYYGGYGYGGYGGGYGIPRYYSNYGGYGYGNAGSSRGFRGGRGRR